MQTNYASDLRHILKAVFECNASEPFIPLDVATATDSDNENEATASGSMTSQQQQQISQSESVTQDASQSEVSSDDVPTEGAVEADENVTASDEHDEGEGQPTGQASNDTETAESKISLALQEIC